MATEYFAWARRDRMIVGIVPWYYGDDRSDATSGGYNVSVRQQPKALAAWTVIGRQIIEGAGVHPPQGRRIAADNSARHESHMAAP